MSSSKRSTRLIVSRSLTRLTVAYDLYSKSDSPPNVQELRPYYEGLIKKYFPDEVEW